MQYRSLIHAARLGIAGLAAAAAAAPAPAYLFWAQPALKGAPVTGDEPGIALPLAGATPKEIRAGLLWSMRAGLNVAALQCQFAPGLMTVGNYNNMIRQHSSELQKAYDDVAGYFKRKAPKGSKIWQTQTDQYTTRTYNGFSTLHAQLTFCETAASIGRDAAALPAGKLGELATVRMREFRNSLVPTGDARLGTRPADISLAPAPAFACIDDRGRATKCKS